MQKLRKAGASFWPFNCHQWVFLCQTLQNSHVQVQVCGAGWWVRLNQSRGEPRPLPCTCRRGGQEYFLGKEIMRIKLIFRKTNVGGLLLETLKVITERIDNKSWNPLRCQWCGWFCIHPSPFHHRQKLAATRSGVWPPQEGLDSDKTLRQNTLCAFGTDWNLMAPAAERAGCGLRSPGLLIGGPFAQLGRWGHLGWCIPSSRVQPGLFKPLLPMSAHLCWCQLWLRSEG